jgi:hypothetical protein
MSTLTLLFGGAADVKNGGEGVRTELAGRVALVLDSEAAPPEPAKPGPGNAAAARPAVDRAGQLLDSGAAAVLTVLDGERTLEDVMARRRRAGHSRA